MTLKPSYFENWVPLRSKSSAVINAVVLVLTSTNVYLSIVAIEDLIKPELSTPAVSPAAVSQPSNSKGATRLNEKIVITIDQNQNEPAAPIAAPIPETVVLSEQQMSEWRLSGESFEKAHTIAELPELHLPNDAKLAWSSTADMSDAVAVETVTAQGAPIVRLPFAKLGANYWRIESPLDGAAKSVRMVVLAPGPSEIKANFPKQIFANQSELRLGRADIELYWPVQVHADHYEVLWSKDNSWSQTKVFLTKNNTFTVHVSEPRKFAVKIRSLNSRGEVISEYSRAQTVEYQKKLASSSFEPDHVARDSRAPSSASLGPPLTPEPIATVVEAVLRQPLELINPSNGLNVTVDNDQERTEDAVTLQFSWRPPVGWSPSMGRLSYEIQIASNSDFTNPIETKRTERTQWRVKKDWGSDDLFWHVRFYFENHHQLKTSQWSETRVIHLLLD